LELRLLGQNIKTRIKHKQLIHGIKAWVVNFFHFANDQREEEKKGKLFGLQLLG